MVLHSGPTLITGTLIADSATECRCEQIIPCSEFAISMLRVYKYFYRGLPAGSFALLMSESPTHRRSRPRYRIYRCPIR